MKTTENKNFRPKQKLRVPPKGVPAFKRVRLKELASDLNKLWDSLGRKVSQQADELSIKNKQLKQGADKTARAEEQSRLHTVVMESTSDGIFIIDALNPDFPVIYTNQAFFTMTGYAKRDILGQNYFLHYGPDTDPRIVEEIKHTILQGKSFYGEMLHFKKNGEKYWNLLRIAPVRDSHGAVTHYIGIKTDITLMRQRDLEIKEQREELLHVTRVGKLAEFVSSLAHEISQPLASILSYAQAAQRMLAFPTNEGPSREPQVQEVLGHIIDDDHRATEVIRRLRSLLKKDGSEMKPIDINALVNETVVLTTTDLNVRNIVLKLELESNLPLVFGDRIQIQQVLLNLISNSFDAMEDNRGPREMLIRTIVKDPKTIMVAVKDSGSGISLQNKPKLFDHFFTTKSDGLGMGLSISRSIVEAHGGHLEVENNPDRGVTFYFTIPVSQGPL
jgi:two-component system sensor kinase FixL